MRKTTIITSLGLFLATLLFGTTALAGSTVTGPEARTLVEQGATLLDVRTDREYRERHIEGAMHIPVEVLDKRMGELKDKQKEIVLYCATGRRSALAAAQLREAGFEKVYDLGGIGNWE